jgi:probable addiction module antidote protein/putative addiction module killer protein
VALVEIRQTEVYATWFARLRDREARARIDVRIRRLSLGNPGDVGPVGEGVSELRIDYGPGYRVYFVQRGSALVILLSGGDKSTQDRDIQIALELARSVWVVNMAQKVIETRSWDATEHLETEEDMAAYLDAALEDGDPALVVAALGDIARAKGMSQIAREAGLGRESLYKALSASGNPEFATILKVVRALGLRLHVQAART